MQPERMDALLSMYDKGDKGGIKKNKGKKGDRHLLAKETK